MTPEEAYRRVLAAAEHHRRAADYMELAAREVIDAHGVLNDGSEVARNNQKTAGALADTLRRWASAHESLAAAADRLLE